jgi:hypothetical protein
MKTLEDTTMTTIDLVKESSVAWHWPAVHQAWHGFSTKCCLALNWVMAWVSYTKCCLALNWVPLRRRGEGPAPAMDVVQDEGRKIRLISWGSMTFVSDIKLIRTDTTLDLSQKAEKGILLCSHLADFVLPGSVPCLHSLWDKSPPFFHCATFTFPLLFWLTLLTPILTSLAQNMAFLFL